MADFDAAGLVHWLMCRFVDQADIDGFDLQDALLRFGALEERPLTDAEIEDGVGADFDCRAGDSWCYPTKEYRQFAEQKK